MPDSARADTQPSLSLVRSALTHGGPATGRASTITTLMVVGQHVLAVVLVAIAVIRTLLAADAAPPRGVDHVLATIACGIAILAWHTAGTFLPSRLHSGKVTERLVVVWLLGLAVVWGVAVAVSAEFVWVAFLLWLLAGHLLPVRWGVPFSLLILTVTAVAPVLHHGGTSWAGAIGPLIGGVFAYAVSRGYLQLLRDADERERLLASLTRAHRTMSELQDELAAAERQSGAIAERTRISRDLHDTVAQSLSSIRLLAHAGAGRSQDPQAATTLNQLESLAGESLADVRRIVAALAPSELEDDALTAALRRLLDRVHDQSGLATDLHVEPTVPKLPAEVEIALLRTAQSALANVRLHARADRVVLSLIDAEDSVRLDITDDGIGFDVAAWEQRGSTSGSFGLRFMRSRLRELGGGLDIESTPGEGTALSIHLPIRAGHDQHQHTSPDIRAHQEGS
ncbi:sensor histidine kinase [Parenemella sanctibonifatiensis]|nr:sensor histidine kinase [Parenemella sanctibonifatiensis]